MSLTPFIDWFIPQSLQQDPDSRARARLFVQRHFGAPILGFVLVAYLYAIDPAPTPQVWIILAGILLLYALPLLLRLTGRLLPLSLLSMELVVLTILFSAYEYGGAYSPFLCWLVAVPLAVVFYIGGPFLLRALTLGGVALQGIGFYLLSISGMTFPEHVPPAGMAGLFVVSVFCAAAFVAAMALQYASIVAAKQAALRSEVENRRITEARLREAKDEAERANRGKSEFLAKMSHELRTPLNAIIGFSQIIASELLGPVGTKKYAGYGTDIERSGHHLLQIISEILDLAKIETGKFILHDGEFDLVSIVQETVGLMRPLADARGVPINFEPPPQETRLRGDDLRVKQILLNLLSNATKFTEPGGSITVTVTRERGAGVRVAVADTGVGIPAADLERVLQPFEQVGNAMISSVGGGTGLGLPLARELMLSHGGDLTLASKPGVGTTVTILFPEERVLAPQRA